MATLERRKLWWSLAAVVALGGALLVWKPWPSNHSTVRVGIAPYQDIAMIVNAEPLGLYKRYGTQLELITMAWEDILPAVASAGRALDIGFGGYIEYITKYEKINEGSSDPIIFLYPAYAFKGGAFITFKPDVPKLEKASVDDPRSEAVRRWLGLRIGAQRGSVYEMMLFHLASRHGIDFSRVNIIDTPLDQGFLAAQQGSLDISTAGLTQLTETVRRGGRAVLTMDDMNFADLTGFIVKKSTYDRNRRDIENVIRMWFDSVAYVLSDIDRNSKFSLAYLDRSASTRYTLEEYKRALSQEYFPTSLAEAKKDFIDASGRFSAVAIGETANKFLLQKGTIKRATPLPEFPNIQN